MNIGKALEIIRKEKKVRQVDVAAAVGITQTSYSQIENSRKRPLYATLEAIAKALDVCIVDIYLLALEPEDFPASRREKYDLMYPAVKALIKIIIR